MPPNIDKNFGGLYIYLLGDFRQLPPVKGSALYEHQTPMNNGTLGLQLFKGFRNKIQLKANLRPADDAVFSIMVDRVGNGRITQDDYNMLSTRNWDIMDADERSLFKNALYLCSTNDNAK